MRRVPLSRFGTMIVVDTDQHRGRLYSCKCGWVGWSVWGHALKHAETCRQAKPKDDHEARV